MQQPVVPVEKDLVLIGGGHAHVSVIKKFGMRPVPGVRVTVISRDLLAPYSGMLPGYVAGHYRLDQCHIDLGPLAHFANARLIHDEVIGLDIDNKQVLCRSRPPITYDVLSINIGSSPDMASINGAVDEVVPVKPISHFVERWHQLRDRVLQQEGELHIGVVGAGAGGVELTLAMQYRLCKELKKQKNNNLSVHFHLFDRNDEVLLTHNQKVRSKFQRILLKRGISLHLGSAVEQVSTGQLKTEAGEVTKLNEILWVTKASAQTWLSSTALVLSPNGFISVDPTLQTVSHPNIFAAGDIAHVIAYPRPKAGVFAVRQGLPLARNLRRALKNKTLIPYRPQSNFLSLISTGNKYAVASKSQSMLSGYVMWRWKNWIDRRFMRKFTHLPAMKVSGEQQLNPESGLTNGGKTASTPLMYCGGCGSKVGRSILQKVLPQLDPLRGKDVVVGIDQGDDAAVVKVDGKKLLVHTVDHFRTFIDDPYLFGQICANHALSDLYAMGAEPHTALAMVTLAHATEEKLEQELRQLLSGAIAVLNNAGAALVGGHTNEGDELSLGFAINGLIDEGEILRKSGMQLGDQLILTKAVGTGTLFAAHMRNRAKGLWIEGALQQMLQSNARAAEILQQYQLRACTDITGFGLAGHLQEMIPTTRLGVSLKLDQIPSIFGAVDCLRSGIVSSLHNQNLRAAKLVDRVEQFVDEPRFHLLFDPQTAGGLLASVAADQAADCVQALQGAGYLSAAIIGEVTNLAASEPTIKIID